MHLFYDISEDVLAFTAGKGCHGTEPGVDARTTGVVFAPGDHNRMESIEHNQIFIPRQTHSLNVGWAEGPGEMPDTDAVITAQKGLCVAVKTADCIPVLLYDERQKLVAAVHAGWRGTVGYIVRKTLDEMRSHGSDVHAVIGPGISLEAFEIGDEVYDTFQTAGFPMTRLAHRYPDSHNPNKEKWHVDLWDANRWVLEQYGVKDIQIAGICTYARYDELYSARQETINTGRNINGIMLL